MAKKKSKKKSKFQKLLITLLILGAVFAVILILTPDEKVSQITGSNAIAGLEIPGTDFASQVVSHTGYTLCYSEKDEQPYWVAYVLTREEINGTVARDDNFRSDPSITTGSATLSDYKLSGYDRGHLIPAADLCYSTEAMNDSFYLSNMSPQAPDFNRGIWADLEATVRNFAQNDGLIYVVTGPILSEGPYKTIGNSKVSVPDYYYKAILDYSEPETKAIGFILPNKGSDEDLQSFAVSIDTVEERTGIDFFPLLDDKDENALEASYSTSLWDFGQFYRSSADASADSNSNESVASDARTIVLNILYEVFGDLKRQIVSSLKSLI